MRDPRPEPSRRRTVLGTLGYSLVSLFLLCMAGWGALDLAAALGAGTTGTLRIEECAMRPGTRSGEQRVCLGSFRSSAGERDEHAEVRSGEQAGESVPVTRTLLDEYIQQDIGSAGRAAYFMVFCAGTGVLSGFLGLRHARRLTS